MLAHDVVLGLGHWVQVSDVEALLSACWIDDDNVTRLDQ